jgi:hypothetical protein
VLICILTPLMTTTHFKAMMVMSYQNSVVKRASARVGWVTSWEVWFWEAKSRQYCVSLGWSVTNGIKAIAQSKMGGTYTSP